MIFWLNLIYPMLSLYKIRVFKTICTIANFAGYLVQASHGMIAVTLVCNGVLFQVKYFDSLVLEQKITAKDEISVSWIIFCT